MEEGKTEFTFEVYVPEPKPTPSTRTWTVYLYKQIVVLKKVKLDELPLYWDKLGGVHDFKVVKYMNKVCTVFYTTHPDTEVIVRGYSQRNDVLWSRKVQCVNGVFELEVPKCHYIRIEVEGGYSKIIRRKELNKYTKLANRYILLKKKVKGKKREVIMPYCYQYRIAELFKVSP